jgi:hypothetical protein
MKKKDGVVRVSNVFGSAHRRLRRGRTARIFGLLVGAVILTACGAPSSTISAVSSTSVAFQTAVADGDASAICRLLTDNLTRSLEQSGQSCPAAVASLGLSDPRALLATDIWGRNALVRFANAGSDVFLADINGTWRITAAGCALKHSRPAECELEAG